jgi:hypothetical protein
MHLVSIDSYLLGSTSWRANLYSPGRIILPADDAPEYLNALALLEHIFPIGIPADNPLCEAKHGAGNQMVCCTILDMVVNNGGSS